MTKDTYEVNPRQKQFFILIVVFSLIGIILLLSTEFGGFHGSPYPPYYYYSCLGCDYSVGADTAAIIIGAILLIFQLIIAVNAVLPAPFLKKLSGMKIIPILGIATIAMMIMGGAAFGSYYDYYEWWLEAGFYGGLVAGMLNTILSVLALRIKK